MQKYVIAMFLALLSTSAFAQDSRGNLPSDSCKQGNVYANSDPVERDSIANFLSQLQTAIKANDMPRAALLIHYPLSVGTANAEFSVSSPKEFIKQYDKILPTELRTFLLKQKLQCVSRVGSKGFSVGTGQIWFDEYPDGKVRMFAINAMVYPND